MRLILIKILKYKMILFWIKIVIRINLLRVFHLYLKKEIQTVKILKIQINNKVAFYMKSKTKKFVKSPKIFREGQVIDKII